MNKEIVSGTIGTILSAVGTGLQTNEVLEMISLIITIVGGIITFIVVPLINWYKHAKQDGKITTDEIKDAVEIVKDGVEEINDKTKGGK